MKILGIINKSWEEERRKTTKRTKKIIDAPEQQLLPKVVSNSNIIFLFIFSRKVFSLKLTLFLLAEENKVTHIPNAHRKSEGEKNGSIKFSLENFLLTKKFFQFFSIISFRSGKTMKNGKRIPSRLFH